jgi:hypothetical protein
VQGCKVPAEKTAERRMLTTESDAALDQPKQAAAE